jgi:hypothetical protein|tara:strand:+ start:391 stop:612 length:222 start_codon:yes stop_codon:yes gene_type:complete
MSFKVESGTVSIPKGASSATQSFSEDHKSIPVVTISGDDNQNVFVSDISFTNFVVNSSSDMGITVYFQALSRF